MKPIAECSREELLERAILAIESLVHNCESDLEDKIYTIAHVAHGRCSNPHKDWLKAIEECEAHGKRLLIYDVEKIIHGKKEECEKVVSQESDQISDYKVGYDICIPHKNPVFVISEREKEKILNFLQLPKVDNFQSYQSFDTKGKYKGFTVFQGDFSRNEALIKFLVYKVYVYKNYVVVNDDQVLYDKECKLENYLFQLAEKYGHKQLI